MRICRITSAFPPPWSGLAPGPYELSWAQVKNNVDLTVIAKDADGSDIVDKNVSFPVIRIPSRFDVEFSFRACWRYKALHEKKAFDLIHGHGFSSLGVLIAKKFKLLDVPAVTTMHCVRYTQRKANRSALDCQRLNMKNLSYLYLLREALQEKFIVKSSDLLLAVSESVKKDIIDAYNVPEENVYVVGNGVNTSVFFPKKHEPFKKNDTLKLLWVGRFSGFKGEYDLISACSILRKHGLNFHLKMVGDGELHIQINQLIKSLHLVDDIEIIPYVPFPDIPKYYQEANIFVLPSVSEGMPKVVLEAMACGCPVIASKIPGCRDLIKNGENGFLIPINRHEQLAETILTLYANQKLMEQIGQEARKTVEENYSWDNVAERVEEGYISVLRQFCNYPNF